MPKPKPRSNTIAMMLAAGASVLVLTGCERRSDPPPGQAATAPLTAARDVADHTALEIPTATGSSRLHRLRFSLARTRLRHVDLSFQTRLHDTLGDGTAVVNGGYWQWIEPDRTQRGIQGLVISEGREVSAFDARLGGGVFVLAQGRASLVEASEWQSRARQADFALQCSPRLVAAGRVIDGLRDTPRAPRTALCIRDAGRTLDVVLSDPKAAPSAQPTLPELAQALAADGCEAALNLDGGPSTAASWRSPEGTLTLGTGVELPYAVRLSRVRTSEVSP